MKTFPRYLMIGLFLALSFQSVAINDLQTHRLSLLAKSWAVGKNFHSGSCQISWDDVLIQTIPLVMDAAEVGDFNAAINAMLDQLGNNEIGSGAVPVTPPSIAQGVDLNWLNDEQFSASTTTRLQQTIENFRPRTNCHVGRGIVGEGHYANDDQYFSVTEPNAEQRLLALFRFWNIINYYYPYKNLIDVSWDDVLTTFIPRIYSVKTNLEYHQQMRIFTAQIQDTHAFFLSPTLRNSLDRFYLPFIIKTVEGKAIIYRVAANQTDVSVGDEVLTINGLSIDELNQRNALLTAASNPVTLRRNTDPLLNIGEQGPVQLELKKRSGERYQISSEYGEFPESLYLVDRTRWRSMDQSECSVGYVNMGELEVNDIRAMFAEFMQKDAIIFDIRNYPNGTLWNLVDYLFPQSVTNSKIAVPNFQYPGAFRLVDSTIGSGTSSPYQGRVIILLNEQTQSQAEFTVMGLEQHPNAVKIGSQTAAADGNVAIARLPGEIQVYFTGLGVYYPNGDATQRVGIIPDLFIRPTIEGVIEERDEVLEQALDCSQIMDLSWPTDPQPKTDLFWDAKLSGKGIDIANINQNYTVIPYDFREDGSPVWYLGVAQFDSGVLSLSENSLAEYRYDVLKDAVEKVDIDAKMQFDFKKGMYSTACATDAPENNEQAAKLNWEMGDNTETRCIEEFIFARSNNLSDDFTGLWYGGSQDSGWGISINTQGEKIVAVVYFYSPEGQASWVIGSAEMPTKGEVEIELKEISGYCQGCEKKPIESTVVGHLTLSLNKPSQAFEEGNWASVSISNSRWNRQKMPIKLLSLPVN